MTTPSPQRAPHPLAVDYAPISVHAHGALLGTFQRRHVASTAGGKWIAKSTTVDPASGLPLSGTFLTEDDAIEWIVEVSK